ncbi:MAG: helix-turn-helix domain-containing protein [Anaerolineales bacterium]
MPDLAPILRALDFVERHLRTEVALEAIAGAAGYSVYHFCRLFNAATHHTPYDYLMRRRLSEAAQEVLGSDRPLIEIAFNHQFNSPETFSRAFKRMFDLQPSQARREGRLDRRRLLPPLDEAYLYHLVEGGCRFEALEKRDGLYVAGLMIALEAGSRERIPALWQRLLKEGMERRSPPACCGLTCYPEKGDPFYLAGVEIERPEETPPTLVVKWLPPLTWACFSHRSPYRTLPQSLAYVHHTWLAKSEHALGYPVAVERYTTVPTRGEHYPEVQLRLPIR